MPVRRDALGGVCLAALSWVAPATASGQAAVLPPGEPVAGVPALTLQQAFASCLVLPWSQEPATMAGPALSTTCTVAEAGELPVTEGTGWWWALYRHETVEGLAPDTPARDLDLFPDTILEDELVLFAGAPGSGRVRPVWHDRVATRLEFLRPPRAHASLLAHRRCVNGTAGCMDHPYLLDPDGGVMPLIAAYQAQIRERLPEEWFTNKGIWIDPVRRVAEGVVALPGDANCCSSLRLEAPLLLEGDVLAADSVLLLPDSSSSTWLVLPGESFGPVGPSVSEEQLERRLGASAVRYAEVYLAEGFCTSGARLFPGEPYEVAIGWADAARTRPAFVRARPPGLGWRTPRGVGIGTRLAELEALADTTLTFSGLGWDYGGGLSWQEHQGALGLVLAIDPASEPTIQELANVDPRVEQIFGDRPVRSDHPVVRQLTLRVTQMGVSWASPFDERDCEGLGPS